MNEINTLTAQPSPRVITLVGGGSRVLGELTHACPTPPTGIPSTSQSRFRTPRRSRAARSSPVACTQCASMRGPAGANARPRPATPATTVPTTPAVGAEATAKALRGRSLPASSGHESLALSRNDVQDVLERPTLEHHSATRFGTIRNLARHVGLFSAERVTSWSRRSDVRGPSALRLLDLGRAIRLT